MLTGTQTDCLRSATKPLPMLTGRGAPERLGPSDRPKALKGFANKVGRCAQAGSGRHPPVTTSARWPSRLRIHPDSAGTRLHPMGPAMANWSRNLGQPVILRDGRRLVTLRDASEVFLGFNDRRQQSPWNQYAAELLLKAAASGTRADVQQAREQLCRALAREGLL
jgi:hypothetical protein